MNGYEPNLKLQEMVNGPKKPNKKLIYILSGVITLLLLIILIMAFSGTKIVEREVAQKKSLDDVSVELKYFIDTNKLDSLDAYGFDNLTRVAISDICYGVDNCKSISAEAVEEYIANVFDKKVTFSDVSCEVGDGTLYSYDSVNKKFVFTGNHNHEAIGTKALYTKINTIKRKNDKYELVLNKLYFNPTRSEYITTDPLGINRVYNSKEYMHTTEDGEDVDLTKLSANYENNFDELKNVGTRYKYTFAIKDGHYVLENYEVINDDE